MIDAMLFSYLAVFALPVTGEVNLMTYQRRRNTSDFQKIVFSNSNFKNFYQCLCSRDYQRCEAVYSQSQVNDVKTCRNETYLLATSSNYLNGYMCGNLPNLELDSGSFICSKTSSTCKGKENYDVYRLKDKLGSLECDFSCIGLTGLLNQAIKIPNNTKSELELCDDYDCKSEINIRTGPTPSLAESATVKDTFNTKEKENAISSVVQSTTVNESSYSVTQQITTNQSTIANEETSTGQTTSLTESREKGNAISFVTSSATGNGKFHTKSVAKISTDSITQQAITNQSTSVNEEAKSSKTGIIAGLTFGLVILFISFILGFILWRRMGHKRKSPQAASRSSNTGILLENNDDGLENTANTHGNLIQPYSPVVILDAFSAVSYRNYIVSTETDSSVASNVESVDTDMVSPYPVSAASPDSKHTDYDKENHIDTSTDMSNVCAKVNKKVKNIDVTCDGLLNPEQKPLQNTTLPGHQRNSKSANELKEKAPLLYRSANQHAVKLHSLVAAGVEPNISVLGTSEKEEMKVATGGLKEVNNDYIDENPYFILEKVEESDDSDDLG